MPELPQKRPFTDMRIPRGFRMKFDLIFIKLTKNLNQKCRFPPFWWSHILISDFKFEKNVKILKKKMFFFVVKSLICHALYDNIIIWPLNCFLTAI